MSDDEIFQQPHVQTPPESTIIMPDGWTFKPVSSATLNGDCLTISTSRRNMDAFYSRLVKGDDAKYGDPVYDRQSRLDLTMAFINSRSYHEFSRLPDDVLNCPKVAKAAVTVSCNRYASLSIQMRSNPDVIMALIENVANGTFVQNGVISMLPKKCGETKELLSAIVEVVQQSNTSLAYTGLSLIWTHIFATARSSEQAIGLFARLDWFHPLMKKAMRLMSRGVPWDTLKQTYGLFDTTGLLLSEEVSTSFQKIRYELVFEFVDAERTTWHVGEIVKLCKEDKPFLCYLAYHRPHLLGHCLEATTSQADRLKILDVTCSRTARVNDAGFAHIESVFPSENVPKRDNKLGEFVEVIVSIATTPSIADHFAVWANVDNFGAFLSKFSVSYDGIDSYQRRWFITRTQSAALGSFHWGMLPSEWSQNEAFVCQLLDDVDPELINKIIDSYRAEKNALVHATGLFDIVNNSVLTSNKASGSVTLKPDQEVPTAVNAALYSGSKDMFPWDNKAMVASFSDPKFKYLRNASRQFFTKKNTLATTFTLAMIAFADDIETCKSIIKENDLQIDGVDLLSLIPESTLRELRNDREFFNGIFEKYSGIGPLLPVAFRYEDEFLLKTIDLHPRYMCRYDTATILKSSKVVESALAHKETVAWIFHNLPSTDKENARLVRELMKNESLPLSSRRSVYTDSVPGIVKMQQWCKKLASQLFGCHILRDDRIDDPVISKLANIAHDSHSSNESNRGSNTAYLRSLYTDIQIAFMPVEIAKKLKIHAPVPDKMKTYIQVLPNNLMLEGNRLEKLSHADLKSRHDYLDEIADTACQILEPRRREGRYPSGHYCENFEGVAVKFSYETDTAGERVRALRTMSGKSLVRIPQEWQEAFDRMPATAHGFWGKLHAGYGQRQKAMLLKNGTLGFVSPTANESAKAAAKAMWEGVSIKVYGTFGCDENQVDFDYKQHGVFPSNSTDFPSFVELVVPAHAYGEHEENSIVALHRASVAKGGLGVVFRDSEHPEKLITLDAHGYSTYVQKIVDFLHKYPLHVLSTYMHDFEVESDYDDTPQDMADAVEEEEIGAKFNATAIKVAAILAPPPPAARSNGSRPTKKRRLTQADATSSTPVPEQQASEVEVQAPVAPAEPVSAAAAAAALYWQDDDDEDAAVSEDEASCMDEDDGGSEIDDSSDEMEDEDGDDE